MSCLFKISNFFEIFKIYLKLMKYVFPTKHTHRQRSNTKQNEQVSRG